MWGRVGEALGALVGDGGLRALRGYLSRGGVGGTVHAAHPVLCQKLLEVHVLQLEQPAITWQCSFP